MNNEIEINGEVYVKKQSQKGNRHVVVVDRGWIFAGDLSEKGNRIFLDNAVWLFRWESIGFSRAIDEWKSDKVDTRPLTTRVEIPRASELFRLPVGDDWGIK